MPRNCVVGGCTRTSADLSLSFFDFPSEKNNEKCRKLWIRFVRRTRKDFVAPGVSHGKNAKICSAHFTEDDWDPQYVLQKKMNFKVKPRLRKNAVPTKVAKKNVESPMKKRRRLSIIRARHKEVSRLIMDQQPPTRERIPTVENAAEVLMGFAMKVKEQEEAERVQSTTLVSEAGCSSTVSVDATKTSQSTQVIMEPVRKHHRSKGVTVRSTYWGTNKGTQTRRSQIVPAKDAWTQTSSGEGEASAAPAVEVRDDEDDEEGDEDMGDEDMGDDAKDPDYRPTEKDNGHDSTRQQIIPDIDSVDEPTPPHIEAKYIVFESCLMSLFRLCPDCYGEAEGSISHIKGSLLVVNHFCKEKPPCGFRKKWYSQPFIGNIPAGNVLLSGSILFCGASPKKVIDVMKGVNIASISYPTFMLHQRLYLQPAIVHTWERMQFQLFDDLKERGEELVIGGDARNDSPGHTAKYGSYTFLEQRVNKVIHVELVQKNEVGNSYQMELEALKRGISWLLHTKELKIGTIITDRHMQVTAWIRDELTKNHGVKHYVDVWHISKGLKKKLRAAAAKKDCGLINDWTKSITNHVYWVASSTPDGDGDIMAAKWDSVVNHIMDVHVHENQLFPACTHPPLDADGRLKAWVPKDSKAAEELLRILQSSSLVRGVKKMSPLHQTSSVENYHSIINQFAPKMLAYSYQSMMCRLYLAAMYYNENAGREQKTKKDGSVQWKTSFPRSKGGDYVLQRVLDNPTHEYVDDLLTEMTRLVLAGNKNERDNIPGLFNAPPPLAQGMVHPTLEEAVERQQTRFASAP